MRSAAFLVVLAACGATQPSVSDLVGTWEDFEEGKRASMRVTLREDGTGTIDYLRSGWRVELPPPDTFRWTLARDEFELVFDVPGEYVRSLSYRVRRRGANRLEVVPIAMNGEIVDDAADDSGEMWRVNSR